MNNNMHFKNTTFAKLILFLQRWYKNPLAFLDQHIANIQNCRSFFPNLAPNLSKSGVIFKNRKIQKKYFLMRFTGL